MKIVQAIVIALFIIVVPFLCYIWMMGIPLKVGYFSINIYTLLVFIILFYPLRALIDSKKISLILYFQKLGQDIGYLCQKIVQFILALFSIIMGLIKSIFSNKKVEN